MQNREVNTILYEITSGLAANKMQAKA